MLVRKLLLVEMVFIGCDGNEDEAIACIIDCYCGNCLRKLHQEHRIRVDRNRYDVALIIWCEDCYHILFMKKVLKKARVLKGIIKSSDFDFYFEIIFTIFCNKEVMSG